jgi:hypothetical protein
MHIGLRVQLGPHLLRLRRGSAGPQADEGIRIATLHSLLHLAVYGEDLVLRTLRLAADRADYETEKSPDKSPHPLDDIRRGIACEAEIHMDAELPNRRTDL